MKGVVVVADNPLIVGAIRIALRGSKDLQLLGYIDPQRATATRIMQASAQVVLVDEGDDSEPALAVIRGLREQDEMLPIIALSLKMEGEWLQRALEAGANGAMSKSIHPAALGTLLREVVSGHIFHSPRRLRANVRTRVPLSDEHTSLTERELEVLRFVASGATNAQIAQQLWITQQTVKFHVSNIYRKLEVCNRTEACHYAHVHGLVATEPTPDVAAGPALLALAS